MALGRAIVRHPALFLFDEPLSNLDAKLRVQMRVELKRLHERLETTAIYVTHDQVEAMTLGDRVVVMKDGVVQQVGEPMALYSRPANKFVAGFIGSPSMNFADVTIAESGGGLWAEAAGIRIKVPAASTAALRPHTGKRATLGVRPEALRLANGSDPAEYIFDATVDVVEPLGSEILLNITAGAHALVARVEPSVTVKMHEKVRLAFDPAKLHFFDQSQRSGDLGQWPHAFASGSRPICSMPRAIRRSARRTSRSSTARRRSSARGCRSGTPRSRPRSRSSTTRSISPSSG